MIKSFKRIALIVLSIVLLHQSSVSAQPHNISEGFADVIEPLIPAVVNISTTQKSKKMQFEKFFPNGFSIDDFNQLLEKFNNFNFDDEAVEQKKLTSLGSGFVIDSSGYIVTNHHVIAEADEIAVKMNSGKELIAKVVGIDKKTDLALLKVNSNKPLPFVKFGDSEKSRVGDWILAVGNPFGLGSTVTLGIVSANGRDISSEGIVDNFIQTDAAINRGNSGGPMFNIKGEVIGVNTIILSPSGGNIGIGFATPSSLIQPVIEQLKAHGKVKRGVLGIIIQPVTEDIADSLGISGTSGALVVKVTKKSAAEKGGLQTGDIVLSFNGMPLKTSRQLVKFVSTAPIGQKVPMTIIRSGKKKDIEVVLIEDHENYMEESEHDELEDNNKKKEKKFSQFDAKEIKGAYLAKLNPILKDKFNIDSAVDGLVVLSYKRKSVWHLKGLKPGDVIISANGEDLAAVDQLEQIIKGAKAQKKKFVLLLVNRGGGQMFLPLPID